MRRHRERRREGTGLSVARVARNRIDALVREGLLEPTSRDDENAIADAPYADLERTLDPVA